LLTCADNEDTIILPAVAIAELLTPISSDRRPALLREFTEKFVCPPFDLRAAPLAAKLRADDEQLAADDKYKKSERHVLKADAMIIASAKVAGATRFYSSDFKCRKLARLVLDAPDPPKVIPQNLYSDEILDELWQEDKPKKKRAKRSKESPDSN
jgi:predicted nucleic acid-binding protein